MTGRHAAELTDRVVVAPDPCGQHIDMLAHNIAGLREEAKISARWFHIEHAEKFVRHQ